MYYNYSVCLHLKKKALFIHCFPGKQPENIFSPRAWWQYVFFVFSMNTKNQIVFYFCMQTDKRIIMCSPFVCLGNSLHVFQANKGFTCFPILFSQKIVTLSSSVCHSQINRILLSDLLPTPNLLFWTPSDPCWYINSSG